MRVRIQKCVDIDTEADVEICDVVAELFDRADESGDLPRRFLGDVVSPVTQILMEMPKSVIDQAPPQVIVEILRRLRGEVARWEVREGVSDGE